MKYCTYITFYRGNKLPPFYIGSSSIERVNNGYHGSVKSKQYMNIWKSELKNNPHLFKTKIISKHETNQEAVCREYKFQKFLNVVKSSMYINKGLANVNGFFGMDVSGENNPNYGKKWSEEKKALASERETTKNKTVKKTWVSKENKSKHIHIHELAEFVELGWISGRVMNTHIIRENARVSTLERNKIKACCVLCKREFQSHIINSHYNSHFVLTIEYFGVMYESFSDLYRKTGCSTYLYEKFYVNGFDPRKETRGVAL